MQLWGNISNALTGKEKKDKKSDQGFENDVPEKISEKSNELLQIQDEKEKKTDKKSRLDESTIIENMNERSDELEFEKKRMNEYLKVKKAKKENKEVKKLLDLEKKSQNKIKAVINLYE